MHFSEIIKLQSGKERHTLLFLHIHKPRKNTFEFVGTVLKFNFRDHFCSLFNLF